MTRLEARPDTARFTRRSSARSAATATLTGLGAALPAGVVTNAPIAERTGVDEQWIVRRTGIRERRRVADGERLSDLATAAGFAALADAGLDAEHLNLVLVATGTADEIFPNAAPLVAAALGTAAGAIDVGSACTGFLAGLHLASATVEAQRAEHVLLIGADILSRHTDPDDRRTAAIFGDGAGAVVVSAQAAGAGGGAGWVGPVTLGSDGANGDLIVERRDRGLVEMNGHDTFVQAVRRLSEVTPQAAAAAGLDLDDIDLFVYHQANRRILESVRQALGLHPDRVVDCIGELGNTSAASVPLALDHVRHRLVPGARVLLGAVGAGMTWGACVVEWGGA